MLCIDQKEKILFDTSLALLRSGSFLIIIVHFLCKKALLTKKYKSFFYIGNRLLSLRFPINYFHTFMGILHEKNLCTFDA